MKHLLISYHTCPSEQPGEDLAGGMNVLLSGFLRHTQIETDLVTRSFGEYQRLQLTPKVTIHRLPCGADRPWTREKAWQCLPPFEEQLHHWMRGRAFDVASAHYWMSACLLTSLSLPAGVMFHTLQAQKGTPRNSLEETRLQRESELIERYPSAFLHWHDLHNAKGHYPYLRGTVVRPGVSVTRLQRPPDGPPWIYGWAARNDPIKNLTAALQWLPPDSQLRVAGMEAPAHTPNVVYLGPLAHRQMADFYGSIHQLLNLSAYETYGLSVLEALACGASVGVLPHSDWARRLRKLHLPSAPGTLYNDQQRKTARDFAQAHSWPRAIPSWEKWLDRLAKSEPE